MLLNCVPRGLCSWDFRIEAGGDAIGSTRLGTWRERGLIELGGTTHEVVKRGMLSGRWSLLAPDGYGVLVTAEKPSAFRRRFRVAWEPAAYTLQPRSWLGDSFELLHEDRVVLGIDPRHAFTRRATIRAEDGVGMEVALFCFWLTVLMWQRDAQAAAASG